MKTTLSSLAKMGLVLYSLLIASELSAAPPNIVFIMADDLGYGDLSCYNRRSKIMTPNIDSLARAGMRFSDAHAPGSVCVPTRYGLLTGQYPSRIDWGRWSKQALIDEGRTTIASHLQSAGYQTAMVGKWHLGFAGGNDFDYDQPLRGGPIDHGFDHYFGMHASLDIPPYFYIEQDRAVAPADTRVEGNQSPGWSPIQGAFWRGGMVSAEFDFHQVLPNWFEKSRDWLREQRNEEQPFFLYVALTAPHTPWLPSEEFAGTTEAGMYGDFVSQVDAGVGRILETLRELNLEENTLVIFTSDNGPVWYQTDVERLGHASTGPLRGMKGDAWEGGHRMPFVARWPEQIQAGSESHTPICFTDMLATFASLAEKPLAEDVAHDGVDLTPILTGARPSNGPRTIVHDALAFNVIRHGDWKLITGLGSGGFSKPRTRTSAAGEPKGQLYNLAEDLSEQNNLYDQNPKRVVELEELIQTLDLGGDATSD